MLGSSDAQSRSGLQKETRRDLSDSWYGGVVLVPVLAVFDDVGIFVDALPRMHINHYESKMEQVLYVL